MIKKKVEISYKYAPIIHFGAKNTMFRLNEGRFCNEFPWRSHPFVASQERLCIGAGLLDAVAVVYNEVLSHRG